MAAHKSIESLTQCTLKDSMSCVGVGLHSGKKVNITLRPAEADAGINFIRKDVQPGTGFIAARWYNVTDTDLATTIMNEHGVTLSTIEHLVAALRGCGVDNALIEVDGPEVPIMDGSALPFIRMIQTTGIVQQDSPRNVIWIHRPIEYRNGDKYAILSPENKTRYTVQIEFDNPLIGTQVSSFDYNDDDFNNFIAPARTFGFVEEIPAMERLGLIKGGSLSNAVLLDGENVMNKDGLRFRDEFVRHKILDCIGDFGLLGVRVLGHFYAKKPGHELNKQFIRTLFSRRDAWSYITLEDYYKLIGEHADSGVRRAEQERYLAVRSKLKTQLN